LRHNVALLLRNRDADNREGAKTEAKKYKAPSSQEATRPKNAGLTLNSLASWLLGVLGACFSVGSALPNIPAINGRNIRQSRTYAKKIPPQITRISQIKRGFNAWPFNL
jgi:hypothetical protein